MTAYKGNIVMSERNIISADSHVIESPHMWREYIDPAMRDRAPGLMHGPENDFYSIEGMKPFDITLISTAGQPSEQVKTWRRWDAPGRLTGGWDPVQRTKDAARDGVDAEVLYATLALKMFDLPDYNFKRACFTAFNRWLAEFCSSDPKRYLGIAVIMTDNIEFAVEDLHAARKMGLKGALLGLTPSASRPYSSPEYDPLWQAASELDMPLSLHNFSQSGTGPVRTHFEIYSCGTLDVQNCISALMFSQAFERFPGLKIVSVENDIGWVANFLQRMDHVYRRYGPIRGLSFKSGRIPSETFSDQIYMTFMDDEAGIRTYDLIGVDNLMWSNDYPHGDSTWPHSAEAISRQFDRLPEQHRRQMLRENVLKLYNW